MEKTEINGMERTWKQLQGVGGLGVSWLRPYLPLGVEKAAAEELQLASREVWKITHL